MFSCNRLPPTMSNRAHVTGMPSLRLPKDSKLQRQALGALPINQNQATIWCPSRLNQLIRPSLLPLQRSPTQCERLVMPLDEATRGLQKLLEKRNFLIISSDEPAVEQTLKGSVHPSALRSSHFCSLWPLQLYLRSRLCDTLKNVFVRRVLVDKTSCKFTNLFVWTRFRWQQHEQLLCIAQIWQGWPHWHPGWNASSNQGGANCDQTSFLQLLSSGSKPWVKLCNRPVVEMLTLPTVPKICVALGLKR